MRPSRSHSRRAISEPPRRPATAILTPLAPAFIVRWIGLLHRLAEGDPAGQLLGDVHRDEVRVELRLADLLDLQLDLALRERADLLAQDLDVRAALADDDARLGRVDRDRDVVDAALDLDQADARVGEPLLDQLADRDVLLEEVGVFLVGVPLGGPGARDTRGGSRTGGPCVPCSGLPVLDDDGDVGHGLVDRERPTLGPRSPALDRRALVGVRLERRRGPRPTGCGCSRRWPWRS